MLSLRVKIKEIGGKGVNESRSRLKNRNQSLEEVSQIQKQFFHHNHPISPYYLSPLLVLQLKDRNYLKVVVRKPETLVVLGPCGQANKILCPPMSWTFSPGTLKFTWDGKKWRKIENTLNLTMMRFEPKTYRKLAL